VTVNVPNTPARAIRTIVLSAGPDGTAEAILIVTSPGATQPLMVLRTFGPTSAGGDLIAAPDLGSGLSVPGTGDWTFDCTGTGTFVVVGV
jgi:hypothetical protein